MNFIRDAFAGRDDGLLSGLREHLVALDGSGRRHGRLLRLAGDARFALLGEASHGTHEFYQERADITRRLILEKGFTAVAVEADWPDAWRVNRCVRGHRATPMRRRPFRASAGSRPGCGATPWCAISWSGCASTTRNFRARSRSASTASTCTACSARFRRCCTTWTGPTRRPPPGPGPATPASRVREGLAGSWENLLHRTGVEHFLLPLKDNAALREGAAARRLQRAIGVIYRPDTERQSHYFHTRLADQFDALIHLDETTALSPLDTGVPLRDGELPETYPSGV